jgi:hypothetical protein
VKLRSLGCVESIVALLGAESVDMETARIGAWALSNLIQENSLAVDHGETFFTRRT